MKDRTGNFDNILLKQEELDRFKKRSHQWPESQAKTVNRAAALWMVSGLDF